MLAAAAEDDRGPRVATVTPAERAVAARSVAADEFRGAVVCRACALDVVERLVRLAVETAERDLRSKLKEQMQWPN